MNKRIASILLCFIMVFAMMATAMPALAAPIESTQLKVIPDITEASPGDIITYKIVLGPVSDMGTMQMDLEIPTGLTYVENSGKLADNLKSALGYDDVSWTDITRRIIGVASAADYESTTDTLLATFQCKVEDYATGTLEVSLDNLEFYSCQTWEDHTERFSVAKTPVTITAAPKPATNITLNKSATTIYTGNSETLVATVEPSDTTDTVVWNSSKDSVATVDNTGKVTAVAPGTATITATAGSKFASCVVTVEDAPCTHAHKTTVDAKNSTCTDKGWDAYKKCDDCGQLFDMSDNKIDKIPYRPLAAHTGGTATCTHKAVCTVCGNEYGEFAAHSYTAETKKTEALKTAGTCKDEAVYYYSCSACGAVEHNDAHTFLGDKDTSNHVGGTTIVNAKEPNHVTNTPGYTGDKKCNGCGIIIETGAPIAPGGHTPASTWNSDDEYHWKTCNYVGCGVVIDGSKAPHTSTGSNVATCQHKAICDVCGVEYGELAEHNPASDWTKDASGHWHACQTAGCSQKFDFEEHTPDREEATEEDPVKCTECGYIITPALGHTHILEDETKFEYDETNHWNACSACNEKLNLEAHEFEWVIDKEAAATEKGSKHEKCKVCGYEKAAVEIPATGTTTEPTEPTKSNSVQTGDNRMMLLWIALLFASGVGVFGTALYSHKKKSVK